MTKQREVSGLFGWRVWRRGAIECFEKPKQSGRFFDATKLDTKRLHLEQQILRAKYRLSEKKPR
jgi:hypothetical protein